MEVLMLLWSALLVGVMCIWLSRHMEISRAKRDLRPLSESHEPLSDQPPLVSVLIAGKDEEANIETAVRTMLQQDYPCFELIVANDRSTDRTGEILESIRREQGNDKLRVIHIKKLRDGWFGKNNAMREAVNAARGEWLCFGDADCRQTSTRTLSTAVQHVLTHEIDFLSILPELERQSVWEWIIQPACGGIMVFWFDPRRVNNPKDPSAYANGAFMLMSRRCYEAIGGHEEVRTQVNEDMHMARLAKERGLKLHVAQSDGLYSVRMYTTFRQIWHGWTRIFYGCFGTFRRLRVSMLLLMATNVFPYLSLLAAAVIVLSRGWADAGQGWRMVLLASSLAVGMQLTAIARFYRLLKVSPLWAPTFIVGAFICIGMLGSAMVRLRKSAVTTWRGTQYSGNQVVKSS